jgi:hypothetical protein
MVKFAGNRRAAILIFRIFLVWSLFAIALAPPAKADGVQSYQYTFTFTSAPNSGADSIPDSNINMSISFVTSGLLGSTSTTIDPNVVQVLEAPTAFVPAGTYDPSERVSSPLVSLQANDQSFSATFLYQAPCPVADQPNICSTFRWQRFDNYEALFNVPLTGTGTFPSDVSVLSDSTNGNDPIGESHAQYVNEEDAFGIDSVSVMATPEPTTGLLVGACFLCTFVALRRRMG